MLFYEIIGEDNRPAYEADLAGAHKVAKCKRPYALVTVEVVLLDTSKAALATWLKTGQPTLTRTGKTYTLTPRGGLNLAE